MNRQEALHAALEFVDGLAPRTNDRGYRDQGVVQPRDRITEVLRVADWLLLGSADETPQANEHPCCDCGSRRGDIVHIGGTQWRHAYGNCDTEGRSA